MIECVSIITVSVCAYHAWGEKMDSDRAADHLQLSNLQEAPWVTIDTDAHA